MCEDEMRDDEMHVSDFYIGLVFWMSGCRWRCTDVGTRVVVAIKLDYDDDPSWYKGPPYAVCEFVIDESDLPACSLTRYGGNSYAYTDEEIERNRNSGKDDIVSYSPPPMSAEERERYEAESRANAEAMQARWIEEQPLRDQQDAAEWEALKALRAARK